MELVVESGPGAGLSWDVVAGEVLIGRSRDVDLPLADPGIAKHHAALEVHPDGRVIVRALDGQGRTRIEGRVIHDQAPLEPGARLDLGPTALRIRPRAPQPGDGPPGAPDLARPAAPPGAPDWAPGQPVPWPPRVIPTAFEAPTVRRRRYIGATVTFIALGVIILLVSLAAFGLVGTTMAFTAAVLPAPLLVAFVRSIDRYEPEPVKMLALTFGWGATAAIALTLLIGGLGQLAIGLTLGPDVAAGAGIVVIAPVVEELLKAAAVGYVLWRYRHQFSGVTDGIVYGAMVGMGFAVTEDLFYYGAALIEGGEAAFVGTVVVRGILSPFAHSLFTAFTGIGLALSAEVARARWLPAVGGLLAAMGLHAAWNFSALAGVIPLVYLLFFVPLFILFLIVARRAVKREGRIIATQLEREVQRGLLTPDEVATLSDLARRRAAMRNAQHLGGDAAARHTRVLHQTASHLAFLRHRLERSGRAGDRDREVEMGLVHRLAHQKASLGGPIAAPAWPSSVT